tara:strand:- start:26 stop:850 length:825 start_codon:yes stop_codon:yes gene_type:complete
MPTADPFTALVCDGFPLGGSRRLDKIDVTDMHQWVTLGGYKKGDTGGASDAQIITSRRRAMALFWNAYKINGVAQAKRDRTTGTNYDQTVTSASMEEDYRYTFIERDGTIRSQGDEAPRLLPNTRVCAFQFNIQCSKTVFLGGASLSFTPEIYAMYEGSVDDYDNFIGFGSGYLFEYYYNGYAFMSGSRVKPRGTTGLVTVNSGSVWASMLEEEPQGDNLYFESTVAVSDIEVGGENFPLININYKGSNTLDNGNSVLSYALPTSVDKIDSYTY